MIPQFRVINLGLTDESHVMRLIGALRLTKTLCDVLG